MIAAMVSRLTGGGERRNPRDPMDRAAVVIPGMGPTYIVSWFALIFFMGLGILFVITTGQVLAFGVAFGSFALLGLAGILYFRPGRTFEADSLGIRLRRGNHLIRDVSWSDVRRFRYGIRVIPTVGYGTRPGAFLTVSRQGLHRGFDFDTEDYALSQFRLVGDLSAFAARAATFAQARGVPIERRDLAARRRSRR